MSYGGHVFDMIKRQRENRVLQKQKRQKFARKKENFLTKLSEKEASTIVFPKLSKAQIEKTRKKVRLEIRREKRVVWLKTMFTFMILVVIVFVFVGG